MLFYEIVSSLANRISDGITSYFDELNGSKLIGSEPVSLLE